MEPLMKRDLTRPTVVFDIRGVNLLKKYRLLQAFIYLSLGIALVLHTI